MEAVPQDTTVLKDHQSHDLVHLALCSILLKTQEYKIVSPVLLENTVQFKECHQLR